MNQSLDLGEAKDPTNELREECEMELPKDVVDDVRKRLRRIAGQVQGVERMLVDGRECRDVVAQLSAATKALDQAGFKLIASGLCIASRTPTRQRLTATQSKRSNACS